MSKSCNRWNISLLVAILLSGCGIWHFADPVAMEGSPSDLSVVKDLTPVHNDAGTEPMGFCAKEKYALQGSSSKVLACWDGDSLPSLQGCNDGKWKHFSASSGVGPSWGFASAIDIKSPLVCNLLPMENMNFMPTSSVVIKIDHKRTMPRVVDFFGIFSYGLLYIPVDSQVTAVPVLASWDYATNDYVKDEIPISIPDASRTYRRGIALRAMKTSETAANLPGWFIRGLAIIQK